VYTFIEMLKSTDKTVLLHSVQRVNESLTDRNHIQYTIHG